MVDNICPICLEEKFDAKAELQCDHCLCLPCLETFLNTQVYPKKCPMCRAQLKEFTVKAISSSFKSFTLNLDSSSSGIMIFKT